MGTLLMKIKIYGLTFFILFCSIQSFAQTKVITTDGRTLNVTSVQTNDNNIVTTVAGENQTISKSNVLVVVPEGKKGYTYRAQNGKKLKIRKRDINNNYQGKDIPRIYAYKYLGTQGDIHKIYITNSDTSLSFEEFKTIFNKQQKKLRTGNIVSIGTSVFILLISLGGIGVGI